MALHVSSSVASFSEKGPEVERTNNLEFDAEKTMTKTQGLCSARDECMSPGHHGPEHARY